MKTNFKKALCSLLVVVMCLTMAPLQGFIGLEFPDFELGNLFSTTAKAATEGYYTYTVVNDESTITDVDESISGDIIIPTKLGGYPVTSIGEGAFYECESLSNVTIPWSVLTIEDYAFSGCISLEGITIPDSVTSIGNSAFAVCESLASITIPDSVKIIGKRTFMRCANLAYATIPDSIISIGDAAFACCSSLMSVTIPDSVTSIGNSAFAVCESLVSIEIPDSVTSIGGYAFDSCVKLENIKIPNSIISIYEGTFLQCYSLTSIVIPLSVTSIELRAFEACDSLTDVYYTGTKEQCKNISIGAYNDELLNATIHFQSIVPDSEIKYSQTHVIDNYQTKNNKYKSEYFSNRAVAMDGSDGIPDLCIPGLTKEDNLVPQGITYYAAKNWILISAYSKNENTPSVIFALDKSTGDYVAEFEIYRSDGTPFTGHLGGITVSSNNLYLTNGKKISYIPLSEFNVEKGTSKTVEIKASYTTYLGSDGASVSYLSITDGILYAGNFYNESDDYDTPANPYFNSIVFGYKLSGSSSTEEWNNYTASAKAPDIEFYIPDEINEIQCATVKDRKLYLSASYGRKNDSRLYVVGVSSVQQQTFDYADMEYVALPMMEGMTFINDDLYAIFESGAYFYREKDSSNIAKNPTDVVWKICVPETNIYDMGEETYRFRNFGDFHSRGGHCFGMSMTSSGYYNKELDVSDVGLKAINTVYTLDKTSKVKDAICYYQDIQGSYSLDATVAGGSYYRYGIYDIESDWAEVVNYVKNHKYDNKGSLQIGFRKNGQGGHAINFLRYEEVNGKPRIYVYDNNFPDKETYFYEDSNGDILQAPDSTFSGAIDCIALRSVEKYYDIVGDYDSRKTWFSDKDKISITSTNVYPIDGNIEMGERVVFELSEDVETIVITPLVDNATFTYMGNEYTFEEIDEDTYAEFTLSETESDVPEFEIINAPHEHIYAETKTEPTCTATGLMTYACSCGDTYSETIAALGHTEEIVNEKAATATNNGYTGDVVCSVCGELIEEGEIIPATGTQSESCDHMCHKSGFVGFIWKIVQFFWKLFNMNPVCECGAAHY